MDKNPPDKIADRYEIKGTIGSGGMGVVLLAHDPNLGIDVAIKILQKEASEKAVTRLQREAVVGGKLSHHHIGKVFNFGQTEDGTPYMVMEYFKGQTLADLIKYKGHLSYQEAKPVFKELCEGLAYAHHQGVVHRDLKPSNVFLARQGQGIGAPASVKLLDFGVAKIRDTDQDLTAGGSVIGSPLYMSPESAHGSEADNRSDIYSMGCLMFETLTGKPPFQGKTVLDTVTMHKNNAPPLVREDLPADNDVPKSIEEMIDRCLRKSPEARFQQVEDILTAIDPPERSAGETESIAAPKRKSPLLLFLEKRGINPVIAGLVGLAITLLCFLSVALLGTYNKKEDAGMHAITKKRENHIEGFFLDSKSAMQQIIVHEYTKLKTLKAQKLIGDEEFKRLAGLDFQALDISDADITGVGLNYVKDKNISWLKMRIFPESRELLKYACNIKNLTYLELITPTMNEEDFSHIARLKKLTHIVVRCENLSWKGFNRLKEMPNLSCISFYEFKVYDHFSVPFNEFPSLAEFYMVGEKLRDEDLSGFKGAKKIIAAKFLVNGLTDKVIEYFYSSAATLNVFSLVSDKSSINAGELFTHFPILQKIELGNGKTISAKSARIITNRALFELNLEQSPCDDQIMSILSTNKTVYWLSLGKTKLTGLGYKYIAQLPNLVFLILEGEKFNDDKVKELAKSKTLTELNVNHTDINDRQLTMLAGLRNLKKLTMVACPNVTESGLDEFRKNFKQNWKKESPVVIMETKIIEDMR